MYKSFWVLTACLAVAAALAHAPLGRALDAGPAPDIVAETWINSPPQTLANLRGKVVLVEFWTFGCYNCWNVEPYVKAWHEKYADQGLVVVGVHTPEFPHERDAKNVEAYCRKKGISYPIALDNDFSVWNRFANRAWPAMYLIDKRGNLRHVKVGEGGYAETEGRIRALLAEEGGAPNA